MSTDIFHDFNWRNHPSKMKSFLLQATREALKNHVRQFGDQLNKENDAALIIDGQVFLF